MSELPPGPDRPVRLSIFVKQVVVSLLLIVLVVGVTARLFFSTARTHLEAEIGRRLEYVARIAARYTPEERLELIRPGDDRTRMVLRLEQKLGEIREATGVRDLYVFRPDRTSLLDVDSTMHVGGRRLLPQLSASAVARLEAGFSVHSPGYQAADGEMRMSAFAPVEDEQRALFAIVGVDAGTRELAIVERMRNRLYWISGVCGAAALLAALLFARSITKAIRHIGAVAERLGRGDYGARAAVQTHDELGALAESINRMADQIRERDTALKEMAASVAHEIRNPLNSIQLLLTLLGEDLAEGRTQGHDETLHTLRYELGKLSRFVAEFLIYSRPMQLMEDGTDAATVVAASVDMASGEAQQLGVDLRQAANGDLPPIMVDRQRLEQSLLNLIINGVQAAGPGGAVTVWARSRAGGVDLVVEDSGPGISAVDLPRVFEPFFTTKAEGTGLGLANAAKIAAAHGGFITAENMPGGGARFTLHLPTDQGRGEAT